MSNTFLTVFICISILIFVNVKVNKYTTIYTTIYYSLLVRVRSIPLNINRIQLLILIMYTQMLI